MRRNGKRPRNVRTEFDGDADGHDEVDQRQSVQSDRPEEHQTEHARQNHGDRDYDDRRRPQVKSEQDESHTENCCTADAEIENGRALDREVLLVEDVEHTVKQLNSYMWLQWVVD